MATRKDDKGADKHERADVDEWLDKEIKAGRISERQLLDAADKARKVRTRANDIFLRAGTA